ncbi:hypothetical protein V8D89_008692 [Ganoderma adspersum]
MSTTCATATETREVPDRPQFLVRTTQFLKRVSNFRTASRKGDNPNRPSGIARAAQSMDLGSKVETKLEVRPHHSFDQSRDSGEESPSHLSLRGSLHPNRASSSTTDSPIGTSLHQIDGLPCTTYRFLAPATTTTAPTSITSHTRSQTLPSGNPARAASSPHNARAHSHSTIGPSGRRALPPYTAGGSARLTPSWVTRQPPMPLLNLPTLPPPTPPQPARSLRPTAPLRSLPALPMQGPSDTEQDADHENASVDDEDEEEDGDDHAGAEGARPEGDSDSSEDDATPSASSLAGPSRISGLPAVDTSSFNVSFGGNGSPRTPQASPRVGPSIDYFTSKPPEVEPPDRTPRPSDFRPNGKGRAIPEPGVPQPRIVSMPQPRIVPMPMPTPATPGAGAASRPNLYHHASKSMVDLMSLTRKDKDKVYSPKLGRATPKMAQDPVSVPTPATEATVAAHKPDAPPPTEPPESESDDVIQSSMLRRRRSLPVYEPSSDPPPYPDPLFRRRGQAAGAEEEGNERLPAYSNAIYLAGVMPCKMEFTRPGVQAKDRKWRRVYCVLQGTAFRVFKCPPAASRVGALEQWWERKVGAGDFTSVDVSAVTASGIRVSAIRERERLREEEDAPERIPKIVEEPAPARTPEPQREPERQGERDVQSSSPPSPPRSKSSSRTLGNLSASPNDSTGSSMRLSMDSRASESSRNPSHSITRHSMDTVGSSQPSVASSSNTHSTACTGLTVPSTSPTSVSGLTPNERSSRRRSFLSQSTSGSSSSSGSPPEQTDIAKGKEKEKAQGGYMPDLKKDLLQQYSLQNAESGLASDYQKRKNVIRVRMEGQQFLLQAKDVAAVIDWIEGIQMGTNVALDLDDRPMPRGPIFPRRRRRRPRRPEPANADTGRATAAVGS